MIKFGIVCISKDNTLGLERTIDSILSQDYTEKQIVFVVSNYSVLDASRIQQVKSVPYTLIADLDRSLYDAMNLGTISIRNTCDYIIYMNAGDSFFSPGVLSSVSSRILSLPVLPSFVYGTTFIKGHGPSSFSRSNIYFFPRISFHYPVHQACFVKSADLHNFVYPSFLKYSGDLFLMETILSSGGNPLPLRDVVVSTFDRCGGVTSDASFRLSRGLDSLFCSFHLAISFPLSFRVLSLLVTSLLVVTHVYILGLLRLVGLRKSYD